MLFKNFKLSTFFLPFLIIIFWACQEDEPSKLEEINSISLTITEDTTSYVFSEITCTLNKQSNFEIDQYGFCWDTIAGVNVEKQNSSFGILIGQTFQKKVESLFPNKTYYVKAYIKISDVINYSNELIIQTMDAHPIVTTSEIINIQGNSAESGGTAKAYESLFPITQKGICWAKTTNPTISDSLTINSSENISFKSELKNLDVGINYYVRAYAINSEGISYGNELTFSTLDGIPELTTDSIVNINSTSATFYGNIIENDGLEICEKGFCWSTSTNPTISNNARIVEENILGSFNVKINEFDINTTFYVKAYIKNSEGIFYGDELSFTTEDGLPKGVVTNEITDITATAATGGGEIVEDGGFAIIARGVCWSTSANPTTEDAHTTDGTGEGSFISSLIGLIEWNTYYVRAYATNSIGTVYGDEVSFTIIGTSVMDYDGNVYDIVEIGNQVWMAENLKTTHYADGTPITLVTDNTEWASLGDNNTDYAYCYYDNDVNIQYGALYTWAAAMNGDSSSEYNPSRVQGVCPDDWHIPSDEEWLELIDFISAEGYSGQEGTVLKSTTGWHSDENGTDIYGFNALPGGYRDNSNGSFLNGYYLSGHWWSSTELGSEEAHNIILYNTTSWVSRTYNFKSYGLSVRCLRKK